MTWQSQSSNDLTIHCYAISNLCWGVDEGAFQGIQQGMGRALWPERKVMKVDTPFTNDARQPVMGASKQSFQKEKAVSHEITPFRP